VPPYEVGHWQEDYGAGAPSFWTEKNPLGYRLLVFNRRIEDVLRKATRKSDLRAMLFSDGAFVVAKDLAHVALIAGEIMRICILNRIPVRVGLALGTFQPLKFSAETIGNTGLYASLFYGTGVVRAHFTERSGKGMRIFVHPSAIQALPPNFDGFKSSSFERTLYQLMPLADPTEHASHELEFLHRLNPTGWHHPPPDNSHVEDARLWNMVHDMRKSAPSSPEIRVHYDETLAALERMRLRIGRPAYPGPE
jgi:hypothetical protein